MGCNTLKRADEQPVGGVEYSTADGVNIMQITVPLKDTIVPQHSHEYDHTTLLTNGKIKIWQESERIGSMTIRKAPDMIYIKAGVKHTFQTLEDNTILYCIHNISRNGIVEVKEEHQIVGDEPCLGE